MIRDEQRRGERERSVGGKRMSQTSFALVSLLFWTGRWVLVRLLEELTLKPTLQLRVGQNLYLSWDKISLHTINQIPRLPGNALQFSC